MLFVCFGRFFSFVPRRSSNLLFFPFFSDMCFLLFFPCCFWFCLLTFFWVSSIKSLPFGSHGDRARLFFKRSEPELQPQEPNLPQKIFNLPIDFSNLPKGGSVSYNGFPIKTGPKLDQNSHFLIKNVHFSSKNIQKLKQNSNFSIKNSHSSTKNIKKLQQNYHFPSETIIFPINFGPKTWIFPPKLDSTHGFFL